MPHPLLPSAELPEGIAREIPLPGSAGDPQSLIVLRHQGQVRAYRNLCPHLRVPLNWQPEGFWNPERTALMCAMHKALFNPVSGECTHGPCFGRFLESVAVHEQNGIINLDA
ncbi:Rieske (2Fe-2S) protein [Insolitispirillum peregrinum]|uniref:Rieske (2Fe-2S) protein n=1 Tax=Insolitispirillum peregrinum TaxID=80876 RepID=UPI0036160AF9